MVQKPDMRPSNRAIASPLSLEQLEDRYVPATDLGVEPPSTSEETFIDVDHYLAAGREGTIEVVDVVETNLKGLRQVLPYGDRTRPLTEEADIDGDGDLELVVAPMFHFEREFVGQAESRVWVYDYERLLAGQTDPELSFVMFSGYRGGASGLEVLDVDGDGTEEIAFVAGGRDTQRHLKIVKLFPEGPEEQFSQILFPGFEGLVRLVGHPGVPTEPTDHPAPLWAMAEVLDPSGEGVLYSHSQQFVQGAMTQNWITPVNSLLTDPVRLNDAYVSDPDRDGQLDLIQVFVDETSPQRSFPLAFQPDGTALDAPTSDNIDRVFAQLDAEIEERLPPERRSGSLRRIQRLSDDVIAATVAVRLGDSTFARYAMLFDLNLAEAAPIPEVTLFERFL
ncbi:hypothetical protein Pan216_40360 [Planctomycetes bacterium Pan216]|uniref:FG-GAP repeat protein n=1 Tax=Kolteria novifilia TaxID=2527975 RepID=A0A518B860_9BACT|nr:hypothetical protein Pan216_40360 [Planctomycetes bacterium Pan216]